MDVHYNFRCLVCFGIIREAPVPPSVADKSLAFDTRQTPEVDGFPKPDGYRAGGLAIMFPRFVVTYDNRCLLYPMFCRCGIFLSFFLLLSKAIHLARFKFTATRQW